MLPLLVKDAIMHSDHGLAHLNRKAKRLLMKNGIKMSASHKG
jgi:hypothetical protein